MYWELRPDTVSSIKDPVGSTIHFKQQASLTIGSNWITDPIFHLVKRSSGIIDRQKAFWDSHIIDPTL